ncbi:MAG: type II toxin-antitoxin system Phd/YefM family antitoxin [Sphingomicrobium sp.]
MGNLSRIKPISYFKANAADILRDLEAVREPIIITQNGEAKAVVQDIYSYEETQQTLAMLKLIAIGRREIDEGKTRPAGKVIGKIRADLLKQR